MFFFNFILQITTQTFIYTPPNMCAYHFIVRHSFACFFQFPILIVFVWIWTVGESWIFHKILLIQQHIYVYVARNIKNVNLFLFYYPQRQAARRASTARNENKNGNHRARNGRKKTYNNLFFLYIPRFFDGCAGMSFPCFHV